jgi:hypothetical protein
MAGLAALVAAPPTLEAAGFACGAGCGTCGAVGSSPRISSVAIVRAVRVLALCVRPAKEAHARQPPSPAVQSVSRRSDARRSVAAEGYAMSVVARYRNLPARVCAWCCLRCCCCCCCVGPTTAAKGQKGRNGQQKRRRAQRASGSSSSRGREGEGAGRGGGRRSERRRNGAVARESASHCALAVRLG